ncbi:MAG: hypothetical protein U9N14_00315 [Pseudomonadota bacterium]|nr:hypothetical protein [Pseudomonadota bacterium]
MNDEIEMNDERKLVIVTGANGTLGEAYLKRFAKNPDYRTVGLLRRPSDSPIANVDYIHTDLLDLIGIETELKKIHPNLYSEIVLIHPVGGFKFESETGLQLDKKIFLSNYMTFINIAKSLSRHAPDKKFVFCCFGSVSDKYDIPWWQSYTHSKNVLRKAMSGLANRNPNIRSVFVNVSTVETGNESKLRPFADKTYWLQSDKIVDASIKEIICGTHTFVEMDVFEPAPDFDKNYYSDPKKIRKKWNKEMKGPQEP